MRTTVTLDADVERLLRDAMHHRRQSFKQTLNAALRRGLTMSRDTTGPTAKRFQVSPPFLGALRPGIDPTSFNKLAAELDDEDSIRKLRPPAGR